MAKTQVLLVGAAGETGGSIANGLIEDGSFVRDSHPKESFPGKVNLAIADHVSFSFHRTFMPLSAPFPFTSPPFRSSRSEESKSARVI